MASLLDQAGELLRKYPEVAVFLTLGVGTLIGRFKIKGFGLGTVVGTLLAGMIIGQAHVEVPTFARSLFFLIFMFATGYHVGPQFFVTLRQGGVKLVVLSLVFAFTGLAMVALVAWMFKFDAGFTGGLLSGGLTQSSVIGTATDAIQQLPLADDVRTKLASHVPVADAVTYLYGTIGVTLLLTKVFPAVMKVNLKAECEKFEEELGASLEGSGGDAAFEASITLDVQAFRLTSAALIGKTVGQFLQEIGGLDGNIQVAQLRRRYRTFKPDARLPLKSGDTVVLTGPRAELLKIGPTIGEQVVDAAAMELPFQSRTVIITNRKAVGRKLGSMRELDERRGQGVHLRRLIRQDSALPLLPGTVVQRGDAAELVGAAEDLDRVTPLLGVADVPTDKTNFIAMGLTVAIGVLVGILSFRVGGLNLGLGAGGGVLIAGLLFGWLQSYFPRLGRIPNASIWLMENLGLNAFVAMVGLSAGPHAVEAMKTSGVQLLLASVLVATVPHVVAFVVGRYALRLNAGQLMGALAGAGTVTAALQSLVDESDSSVPVLGYTVPFAINNILLTAWGPVVVAASQFWATGGP